MLSVCTIQKAFFFIKVTHFDSSRILGSLLHAEFLQIAKLTAGYLQVSSSALHEHKATGKCSNIACYN